MFHARRLEDYIDFVTPISPDEMEIQPYCEPDEPISMYTLDHLYAMTERRDLTYEAEQGLREVLEFSSLDNFSLSLCLY